MAQLLHRGIWSRNADNSPVGFFIPFSPLFFSVVFPLLFLRFLSRFLKKFAQLILLAVFPCFRGLFEKLVQLASRYFGRSRIWQLVTELLGSCLSSTDEQLLQL
jgi:uncharacterized membrane protein HdeD (DUF308 family)